MIVVLSLAWPSLSFGAKCDVNPNVEVTLTSTNDGGAQVFPGCWFKKTASAKKTLCAADIEEENPLTFFLKNECAHDVQLVVEINQKNVKFKRAAPHDPDCTRREVFGDVVKVGQTIPLRCTTGIHTDYWIINDRKDGEYAVTATAYEQNGQMVEIRPKSVFDPEIVIEDRGDFNFLHDILQAVILTVFGWVGLRVYRKRRRS